MSERVKNHRKWQKDLKAFFAARMDVPQCEVCGSTTPPLDFAHRLKRKFILTKEEYLMAALLCRACHEHAEFGKHDRMYEMITSIIDRR